MLYANFYMVRHYVNMSIKQNMGELFLKHYRLECGTPDRLQTRSSPGCVKPKAMKLVFIASLLRTQHLGVRKQTDWFKIRIMCPSGATYLP